MKIVIDRIEEGLAVCENEERETFTLPLAQFSDVPREGDVYSYENDALLKLAEVTRRRRTRLETRFRRLMKK